jgi:glycosyltransferase involved in cell wall biosynthesis
MGRPPTERPPAVELAGYLDAAVGVGEAARRYVGALRSGGVRVLDRDVPLPGRDGAQTDLPLGARPPVEEVGFNLLCLNPEQMVPYLNGPDAPVREGRETIGIWSWEVDVLPAGWREAAEGLTEVWTYSRFAAERIGAGLEVPVLGFPPPLAYLPETTNAQFMPELPNGFRVLIMFDYLSTLERKNPLSAIEAYRRAFAPDDGAVLVVKSVNGRHRPERRAEVMAAVEGRPDVVSIDRTISGAERDALIGMCDCYLSLHRSEGHGMPLAEAMALGKPVVATAYGGNIEFMNDANSYLVAWTPTSVGDQVEHYPAGANWAEPDVEHAARLLRAVHNDPEEVHRRGQRGREDVLAVFAPEVVGRQMRRRLEELCGGLSQRRGTGWTRRLTGRWHAGRRR